MTFHPLDRPVWHAFTGPQAVMAIRSGDAVRLDPSFGPFAANASATTEGFSGAGPLWFVEAEKVAPADGFVVVRSAPLVQMVAHRRHSGPEDGEGIVALGEDDAADMAALAHATEPGPWGTATHGFGGFYGVRDEGRLVAMAGTRMRPDASFAEVSGVCTDPGVRGRGYARRLMLRVMTDMADRGETPFLHSYAANPGAISLYRSLGFEERREMTVTILDKV